MAAESEETRASSSMTSSCISSSSSVDIEFRKVFVRQLLFATSSVTLHEVFSEYGEIEEAVVIMDEATKRSRGYGFVTYFSSESAQKAIAAPIKLIDGRSTESCLAFEGRERLKKMQSEGLLEMSPYSTRNHHSNHFGPSPPFQQNFPFGSSHYSPSSPNPYSPASSSATSTNTHARRGRGRGRSPAHSFPAASHNASTDSSQHNPDWFYPSSAVYLPPPGAAAAPALGTLPIIMYVAVPPVPPVSHAPVSQSSTASPVSAYGYYIDAYGNFVPVPLGASGSVLVSRVGAHVSESESTELESALTKST